MYHIFQRATVAASIQTYGIFNSGYTSAHAGQNRKLRIAPLDAYLVTTVIAYNTHIKHAGLSRTFLLHAGDAIHTVQLCGYGRDWVRDYRFYHYNNYYEYYFYEAMSM